MHTLWPMPRALLTDEAVSGLQVSVEDRRAAGVQVQHAARDAAHDGQQLVGVQRVATASALVYQHVEGAPAVNRAHRSNMWLLGWLFGAQSQGSVGQAQQMEMPRGSAKGSSTATLTATRRPSQQACQSGISGTFVPRAQLHDEVQVAAVAAQPPQPHYVVMCACT